MSNPSIDVVIPVKNGAQFLFECVASVTSQSLAPTTVFVIDDDSDDSSAELASTLGAVVLPSIRPGAGAARNVGAMAATADLIAFLDADDLMAPDRLAADAALLRTAPEALCVVGRSQGFADGPDGRVVGAIHPGLVAGASTFRRRNFLSYDGFDEGLLAGEFIDLVARARAIGSVVLEADHLAIFRRSHRANTTRDARRLAAGILEVTRRSVARHQNLAESGAVDGKHEPEQ